MNSREVALNIINRVLEEGAYSNLVLSKELNDSDLNEKDRALVTELVYGTIRRKKTLDIIISNYVKDISLMEDGVLNILRMAIYQMHFLDKIPDFAACNEAVELSKNISLQSSKLVNGILRSYTKNPDDIEVSDSPIDKLVYTYSYEPWFIRMIYKQYGEENGRKILAGLNATPKVTVRVNTNKADFDEVKYKKTYVYKTGSKKFADFFIKTGAFDQYIQKKEQEMIKEGKYEEEEPEQSFWESLFTFTYPTNNLTKKREEQYHSN